MARQKLPPPAASQPDTSSADDDSSSDEEHVVSQKTPSGVKTPNPTERDGDDSESEDDSSLEEKKEEEEENCEEPKLPAVKKPESEPDKKKAKLSSATSQPPLKKSASAVQRIWSLEDEKMLIRALSDYLAKNGELPPRKDYPLFLSAISGSIQFPVTDGQMYNKIRHMRHSCKGQKKQKGNKGASSSNPDGSSVLEMWTELFASEKEKRDSKVLKKRGSLKIGGTTNGSVANGVINNGVASYGGEASDDAGNGGGANGGDVSGSYFYLGGLIKDMISRQQCPGWFPIVEDVVVRIGESKARELEAKVKMLRIDAMKLHAREETLNAELFEAFADVIADH